MSEKQPVKTVSPSSRPACMLAAVVGMATNFEEYMNMPQVKGPIGRQLVWAPNTDEHKESEVEHNTNLESKDSLKMRVGEVMKVLTETAKKKDLFELDEANGMVFTGAVDSWLAVQAFAEIFNEYDGAAQELLCQVDKEGKILKKSAIPFDSYKANTAGKYVASAQRDSTISFGNWFPNITNLPYLMKLYKTVVTDLDLMDSFTFAKAQVLRYPNPSGCVFGSHTDWGDFPPAQAPHLTVSVLLSPSINPEMVVAGAKKNFIFDKPGKYCAFPAGLYHASGKCDQRKVLIVFTFRFLAKADPAVKAESGPKEEEESSSAGKGESSSQGLTPAEEEKKSDADQSIDQECIEEESSIMSPEKFEKGLHEAIHKEKDSKKKKNEEKTEEKKDEEQDKKSELGDSEAKKDQPEVIAVTDCGRDGIAVVTKRPKKQLATTWSARSQALRRRTT